MLKYTVVWITGHQITEMFLELNQVYKYQNLEHKQLTLTRLSTLEGQLNSALLAKRKTNNEAPICAN